MTKEAIADVYTKMLDEEGFRDTVAADPKVLDTWDLTPEEKQVAIEEATTEVQGFAIGGGAVMGYLSGPSGPPLSGNAASALGGALNRSAGLPSASLSGPGFAATAGCCPWGHGIVPTLGGME